jgi:hypothetical protein
MKQRTDFEPLDVFYARLAPCIQPVNEFFAAFIDSAETAIQVSANDLLASPGRDPLLAPLLGLDYDTIRLRLRIISSLNPEVNLSEEVGTITLISRGTNVVLRSIFAPKAASIRLEKTDRSAALHARALP